MLKKWLSMIKAKKRQILSLVGTLKNVTNIVWSGRAFVLRMYSTAAKLYSRLDRAF